MRWNILQYQNWLWFVIMTSWNIEILLMNNISCKLFLPAVAIYEMCVRICISICIYVFPMRLWLQSLRRSVSWLHGGREKTHIWSCLKWSSWLCLTLFPTTVSYVDECVPSPSTALTLALQDPRGNSGQVKSGTLPPPPNPKFPYEWRQHLIT